MMKLWEIFGGAALSVAAVGIAQGQTVCIANQCTNSGSMPNGTYTYRNGVVTNPGNLPADAYLRDPRTGQRTPLNRPVQPSYPLSRFEQYQYPSARRDHDPFARQYVSTPAPQHPTWIELTSKKGTLYCDAGLLDTSTERDLTEVCGIPVANGTVFNKVLEHPYNHVVEMSGRRSAFCQNASPKGKKVEIKSEGTIAQVGTMPKCLIATFN